jgi:concanavalin A-like lectin/glucanase superfamily protein
MPIWTRKRRPAGGSAFAVVAMVCGGLLPLLSTTAAPAAAAEPAPPQQALAAQAGHGRHLGPAALTAPTLSVAAPYKECLANDCTAAGGPGVSATVTATPTDDGPLAGALYWSTVTDAWAPMEKSGDGFTATLAPDRSGLVTVTVRLVDKSGFTGPSSSLDFLVKSGDRPLTRWHFAESSGAAVDSSTADDSAQQDATLYGGAVRDDRGRRGLITHDAIGAPLETPVTDRGLVLNGTSAYAATAGPLLETSAAYTVSAWSRLDSTDADGVVVSQDGRRYSPFALRYDAGLGTWTFGVKGSDADPDQPYQGVVADHSAAVGVWTHLAGSYDPATQELRFYVNGRLQGTSTVPEGWKSTGDFQIGRELWAGEHRSYFHGSIDEVAVWQRALTPTEIADEATTTISGAMNCVEMVADWNPSTASGSTLTDTVSGYGHDLALSGGATLDGTALVLNGTDGYAAAQEPIVDSTGSFTATASVELDPGTFASAPVGTRAQVFEQPAVNGASWGLWYEVAGHKTTIDENGNEHTVTVGTWRFGRGGSSVQADEATVVDGSRVRVTGVYDAQAGTISLYLSINRQGVPTAFTAQPGQGALTVGRSTDGDYLKGRILDARIWAGAVGGSQQLSELIGE